MAALLAGRGDAPLALCRYDDGPATRWRSRGARSPSSRRCTATRASGACSTAAPPVAEVPVAGPVPRDVDTREDYEAVLASAAAR